MSFLSRVSAVASGPPLRAMTSSEYAQAFFGGDPVPEPWLGNAYGGYVNPETALTLSYVYSACSIISDDLGTMTLQIFEDLGDAGRRRVQYGDPGIGLLARKLRWQPNDWQTAKAFWSTMAWQWLLRPAAYAEIIYRKGFNGAVAQLIPRHPDRVRQERLPDGRLRYRLDGEPGGPRWVTQEEMLVVRNTSTDGLNATSRIGHGAAAIASGLALQDFTSHYFRKGATAALLGSYKGGQDEELEAALHTSISRYMSGAENAGGLLLVPEDVDVKALGVDPEKAELLGLKNLSGRDVARLYKMPPSWLGIEGASAYNSQVQDAQNYVNRCLVPLAVEFEQALQRDVLTSISYFAKFNMDYLLRADFLTRMQGYEIGIRSRVLRPSEARVREDYSPDPALDRLSEGDNRPGTPRGAQEREEEPSARERLRPVLGAATAAVACVRRERAQVLNLAKRHASDPAGWAKALGEFYAEHAVALAREVGLPAAAARAVAEQHRAVLEAQGVAGLAGEAGDAWQHDEALEIAALALEAA